MKLLIAEDDVLFRSMLQRLLEQDFEVELACDGGTAWEALNRPGAPRLAILDWMMPELDGIEICRMARQSPELSSNYLLLLTARQDLGDVVEGLEAGANDYITKPFRVQELKARVEVGRRVLDLQVALAQRLQELQQALARVRLLEGFLPICSYCKRIRDSRNRWQDLEPYLSEHSLATFTHGICPECYRRMMAPSLNEGGRSGA